MDPASPANSTPGHAPSRFAQATELLEKALSELELAVERSESRGGHHETLVQQLHDSEQDRARLAEALDAAGDRSSKLERANHDVGQRLDRAIAQLKSALGEDF
ncbi:MULTISPECIES: DUF4164 family protein [Afifella]|uniref:DUF4164 family protein n=1 Tax=Afifella TaxID=643217 RepID=UPI000FE37295|nr:MULTISPECIES: DUF4164 family protein [Afifella]MCF1504165.1 DUF4164 domain-containing protein [Afifella sp. H1R]